MNKNYLNFFNEKSIIFFIIFFGFIFRLLSIDNIFIADEAFFYFIPLYKIFTTHPPIFFLFQKLFIFEGFNWTARLFPIIIGTINIYLIYIFCRDFLNRKTAIFSSFLMAFTFWPILASTMIDINGSILMTIFILTFYFFIKYLRNPKNIYLLIIGFLIAISSLTKYFDTLILIVTLFLIYVYEKRDIKKIIRFGIIIGLVSSIIVIISLLIIYLSGYFENFLTTFGNSVRLEKFSLTIRPFIYLLFWATSLLLGLTTLSFFEKHNKIKKYLFFWLLIPFLIYFFIVGSNRLPYGRYLMVLIPPLIILSGNYLSDIFTKYESYNNKKMLLFAFVSFCIFYLIICLLNLKNNIYIQNSFNTYLTYILNFKFNFFFPYVGSSGPGFWISFDSMLLILILSLFFLFLYFILSKYKFKKSAFLFFILFLSSSFSMNLFLIQEHSLKLINPNVDKSSYQIINYYNNNLNLSENIFVPGYLKSTKAYLRTFNQTIYDNYTIENINKYKNYTLILYYFPSVETQYDYSELVENCTLNFQSSDKKKIFGRIYSCQR